MNIQIFDQNLLLAFWLCFTRWITIIFQLPLFDQTVIPGTVKVLASLVITYAFFPMTQNAVLADINYVGIDSIMWMTIGYALIGLVIGYLIKSIMSIFISGGSLVTQHIGFSAMRYFDPNASQSIGPFESLMQMAIIMLIISSGALIPMFKGVFVTFETMRFIDFGHIATAHIYFESLFRSIFEAAVLLASPLLFTNFLIYLILGIVSRAIPQMNVLMVSFVVNIGLGLLVFISISSEFFSVAYEMYVAKLGEWFQFMM